MWSANKRARRMKAGSNCKMRSFVNLLKRNNPVEEQETISNLPIQIQADALRMETAQILTKHGIFKSGETTDLWIEGTSKPLMILGFQISYDAQDRPKLKPAAPHLMEQAFMHCGTKTVRKPNPTCAKRSKSQRMNRVCSIIWRLP
jgi:hypothetical protein